LNRAGFTLVELIVAAVVASIAGGAMIMTLSRQQRFFASADAIGEVRGQLRDAADVLASDLRGASVARFGVPVMSDSAVEFFATIGTSVGCNAPAGLTIGLPPEVLAAGNTLTSLLAQPDTGDIAMLLSVPRARPDSATWEALRIASFTSRATSTACPQSTGFTTAGDLGSGSSGYMLTLAQTPSITISAGAPVAFVRRVRYSLYKSSDGLWYLGYRRCNATPPGCAAIQPVSGPYRAYSSSAGTSGLSFRFFDASGQQLTSSSAAVARIDIVLRGQTARAASLTGDARTSFRDSAVITVSPRNRQ
jgi:prepilin-type N-terminal cleavage/methylation domain-containing protein